MKLLEAYKNSFAEFQQFLENGADPGVCQNALLRRAALDNSVEAIELLISAGADIHAYSNAALRWAAAKGSYEVVETLLIYGADPNSPDPYDKRTKSNINFALHYAFKNGHHKVVSLLREAGANGGL